MRDSVPDRSARSAGRCTQPVRRHESACVPVLRAGPVGGRTACRAGAAGCRPGADRGARLAASLGVGVSAPGTLSGDRTPRAACASWSSRRPAVPTPLTRPAGRGRRRPVRSAGRAARPGFQGQRARSTGLLCRSRRGRQQHGAWRAAAGRGPDGLLRRAGDLPPAAQGGQPLHFGSKLVFGNDGRLFVTLGDRFSRKDDAQTLDNHLGKIVRIEPDGRVPADNPLVGKPAIRGPRSGAGPPQRAGRGAAPRQRRRCGPPSMAPGRRRDQPVQPGRNFGWPVITFGRNYGIGTQDRRGPERPTGGAAAHWVPTSIAPSGMAFLTSDRYPGWKGNLFIGALRGRGAGAHDARRQQGGVEERLLQSLNERIRDVRQGPDGFLYLLTDNADGRVIRPRATRCCRRQSSAARCRWPGIPGTSRRIAVLGIARHRRASDVDVGAPALLVGEHHAHLFGQRPVIGLAGTQQPREVVRCWSAPRRIHQTPRP
jgi:hypothetical protein